MDVGWNGGSLLAKPNKNWRNLDLANLKGSIAFDGKEMRSGHSGDVLGHGLQFAGLARQQARRARQGR